LLGRIWEHGRSGSLPKLAWLCEKQHCPLPDNIVEAAAEGGSVEMLQWLKQRGYAFSKHTTYTAARRSKNIPVLQFLLEEGCEWDCHVCSAAAAVCDLEQLKWLHQHGATLHRDMLKYAARSGVVSIVDWLQQQQGIDMSCEAMRVAAQHGHLHLCRWLHSAGCPWDNEACTAAVEIGCTDVLRFLHVNGCPWDDENILGAAVFDPHDNANILQYLREQGVQADVAELTELLREYFDGELWHDDMVA
jgi:hypothetical protein